MFAQVYSIGLITLLGAMLPGPDFAIVTKNSFFYSRQAGYYTSLGVGAAILVHMTYCVLGLGLVIANSLFLFNLIKYIGATYLIYLGISSLLSKPPTAQLDHVGKAKGKLSNFSAFKQGFLCNLLNPKATIFFLSLFTVIIKPDTPTSWMIIYALEIPVIATTWFFGLTIILSHPCIKQGLMRAENYIAKLLGVVLIGFGAALFFVHS